ncbi:uncharacterized protein PADG_11102 [Paracoccidioides brasiliensis Pb18]|uniref:Secreted protein n=2 Tax=Paracoccidioides brasiliensis TaxID=121759 RepID=A0A0A0HZ70_PARBD|nr:uncharacterized protein PADG_11102 [Paracoccidioides brasiliensis Pb18]KGM92650.1 hypothetical protein PADG_11102 [Paracoccidioides brasiliensis Pb18]ODH19653.1 hypothetical protein ACO22_06157 [Paracoccidioides brasiliensis]
MGRQTTPTQTCYEAPYILRVKSWLAALLLLCTSAHRPKPSVQPQNGFVMNIVSREPAKIVLRSKLEVIIRASGRNNANREW